MKLAALTLIAILSGKYDGFVEIEQMVALQLPQNECSMVFVPNLYFYDRRMLAVRFQGRDRRYLY